MGKTNGQGMDVGHKIKAQYRPREKKQINGPINSHTDPGPGKEVQSASIEAINSDVNPRLGKALQYISKEAIKSNVDPGLGKTLQPTSKEATKMNCGVTHGQEKSHGADGPVQLQSTLTEINSNNALVLHVGQKKSSEGKSKNKTQRAHIIVQGNLNTLSQQDPSMAFPNNAPTGELAYGVSPMDHSSHSADQWDPNEDIAPDFLEDNDMIVSETQAQQQDEGDARERR